MPLTEIGLNNPNNINSWTIKLFGAEYKLFVFCYAQKYSWKCLNAEDSRTHEPYVIKMARNNEWYALYADGAGSISQMCRPVPAVFEQACVTWLKNGGFAGLNQVDYLSGLGVINEYNEVVNGV